MIGVPAAFVFIYETGARVRFDLRTEEAMEKEPNNKNRLSLQSVRESLRTLSLSTLLLLVTTAVALVAVGSLAWMSENRKLDADGVHANMDGAKYSISFPTGSYRTLEDKLAIIEDPDDSAIVWEMTDDANLNNVAADDQTALQRGVYPGSSGFISFVVTPKADVDLDLTFELCAYIEKTENGQTQLVHVPQEQENITHFLNGHIMLFENKNTEDSSNAANGEYYYTDPILPDANGKRTITKKHFTNGTEQRVDIYWEWPITLSTIVYISDDSIYKPFFPSSVIAERNNEEVVNDYTRTISDILKHPDYYFKDVTSTALTEDDIVSSYEYYGDCYDRADNDIGNTIQFVLLKMTVCESETVTPAQQGGGEP